MNTATNFKYKKLNDLCDQIFDFLYLTYYDLESKIDNELDIKRIKSKFKTFSNKHFLSAIKDFENEIQSLKNRAPVELTKLEIISSEIHQYFNKLVDDNIFDGAVLFKLKLKTKEILNKF